MSAELDALEAALAALPRCRVGGYVTACGGGTVTASGLAGRAGMGDLCLIERRGPGTAPIMFDGAGAMLAEIVGFGDGGVQLLPYEEPGRHRARSTGCARPRPGRASSQPGLAWPGGGRDGPSARRRTGAAGGSHVLPGPGARHSRPSGGAAWARG